MSNTLLRTVNLTKHYGGARAALVDLNLTIAPGEIFGLLGPNGSGKSTALRMLLGFMQPTSGSATIAGFDCWADGPTAWKCAAASRICRANCAFTRR
jgi:ABC-2 type transport system ATP-binding protein